MKKRRGSTPIIIGLLLIAAALLLVCHNIRQAQRARNSAQTVLNELNATVINETPTAAETPDYILNPAMQMPTCEVDGNRYIGTLTISALGLELPVMSEWSYSKLTIAPCRYDGSAYTDNLVIAAHNYASHFGNLKNLRPGDSVTFRDIDGNIFNYEVTELETLQPTAVNEMTAGEWDLTLFTCTVGGSYRITVRCERV